MDLGQKNDVFNGFVSILLLFLVLLVLVMSWFGTVRVLDVFPHVFDKTGWEFLHLCGGWFLLSSVALHDVCLHYSYKKIHESSLYPMLIRIVPSFPTQCQCPESNVFILQPGSS
jgi:hypothetical protein